MTAPPQTVSKSSTKPDTATIPTSFPLFTTLNTITTHKYQTQTNQPQITKKSNNTIKLKQKQRLPMMISQTKLYTHLTLFFFLVALFHATHARSDPQPPVAPPRASNERANNSTLIMLFAFFLFSFFITAFCSFYVRHCSEQYVVELRNKGVEPEVLVTCPIVSYSAAKAGGSRPVAAECAVCLGEFEGPDALRVLPKCGHVFHPGCIDMWLASHVTCPVCRTRMVGPGKSVAEVVVEIGGGNGGAFQVFDESSVREGEGENSGGGCGNFDGCVEEGNGSSKVGAFVRSHSTGHSLVDEAEKSVEVENRVVENKGGSSMKRSASYDVVFGRREGWWWGRSGEVGEGSSKKGKSTTTYSGITRFLGSSVAREDRESQGRSIFQIV